MKESKICSPTFNSLPIYPPKLTCTSLYMQVDLPSIRSDFGVAFCRPHIGTRLRTGDTRAVSTGHACSKHKKDDAVATPLAIVRERRSRWECRLGSGDSSSSRKRKISGGLRDSKKRVSASGSAPTDAGSVGAGAGEVAIDISYVDTWLDKILLVILTRKINEAIGKESARRDVEGGNDKVCLLMSAKNCMKNSLPCMLQRSIRTFILCATIAKVVSAEEHFIFYDLFKEHAE